MKEGVPVRSLPVSRRLQLVKLLRAHGVADVERLREDELKDALARLSILLPDLADDAPFAPLPTSSSSSSNPSSSSPSSNPSSNPSSSALLEAPAPITTADLDALLADVDDPHALPRFHEPKVHLPEGMHTFARAIAVKPGEMFVTWQLHNDVVAGSTRLHVHAVELVGAAPAAAAILGTPARFVVDVDRSAPGWYVHLPHERFAIVVRVVASNGSDDIVLATSNVTLTPPARPATAGPLWRASMGPGVDRRRLRGGALLGVLGGEATIAGVDVVVAGTVAAGGIVTDADGTEHHHGWQSSSSSLFSSSAAGGAWSASRTASARPGSGSNVWSASRPSSSSSALSSSFTSGKDRP